MRDIWVTTYHSGPISLTSQLSKRTAAPTKDLSTGQQVFCDRAGCRPMTDAAFAAYVPVHGFNPSNDVIHARFLL